MTRRTKPQSRGRFGLVFVAALTALALGTVARADDISNNLDTSADAVAETMALSVGGANGATRLYVVTQNGDGKQGCNLTGSTTASVSLSSSNTSVATVSPSSITFTSCVTSTNGPIVTVTPVGAGSATISATLTGNTTDGSFNVDAAKFTVNVTPPPNTPPDISIIGVTGGASYNKGAVPSATCDVTDAEDGTSSFAATLSSVTGPYASDGIGEQTASCSYTDDGGLTASASVTYGIVDPLAPGISYLLSPAAPDGNHGWYRSDVSLVWTVSEPQSPNSLATTGCVDQSITSDQAATAYGCSATSAGGSAGPVHVSIKRDATPPSVSGSPTASANSYGWYASNVTIGWTCSDATSGLAAGCPADSTISGEGEGLTTTSGNVFDTAGNFTNATSGPAVNIDRTKPTISGTPSPAANGAGWNNEDVTVSFQCADGLSKIASCGPDQVLSSNAAGQTATGTATDKAGNSESVTVDGINIDKVAPSIVGSIAPAAPNGSNGWYVTAPTVSFSCNDSLSGVATCTGPATLGESAAGETVTGGAVDVADNSASDSVGPVKVDLSDPVLQCGTTPTFMVGQLGTVSASVSDSISGPAAASVTAAATNPNGGSVTLTGYDDAGRSASVSCPYHVVGATFLQPINGRPTVNIAKLGRVIPVKVQLLYDGVPQTDLNTAGGAVTIGVATTSCTFTTEVDDIEAYAAGASNTGLQFRWDSLSGFWIYNLDTSSFAMKASTCYQASVYLNGTKAGYFFVKITK
ncbi:MAG TPA: PxKF domain-containing protein [Gaiellaceae bacterium]|nr:PxKF domain-containing protein [Gaiellaceae bacterium]